MWYMKVYNNAESHMSCSQAQSFLTKILLYILTTELRLMQSKSQIWNLLKLRYIFKNHIYCTVYYLKSWLFIPSHQTLLHHLLEQN